MLKRVIGAFGYSGLELVHFYLGRSLYSQAMQVRNPRLAPNIESVICYKSHHHHHHHDARIIHLRK